MAGTVQTKPSLHIVEGPVGAGKTTFARHLGRRIATPPLILDDWMIVLFRPDQPEEDIWPWYAARKARCHEQIWRVACDLLSAGHDAIVELGLLSAENRRAVYDRARHAGHEICVHILDVPKKERWRRVSARNSEQGETFAMFISQDVFRVASDMWEPPDPAECAANNVIFVDPDVDLRDPVKPAHGPAD